MGIFMGSSYVNDFDFNNRSYRVYVQADQQFRRNAGDLRQYYVRSDTGKMVPLDNLAASHRDLRSAGHQPLQPLPLRRNRRFARARASVQDKASQRWNASSRRTRCKA